MWVRGKNSKLVAKSKRKYRQIRDVRLWLWMTNQNNPHMMSPHLCGEQERTKVLYVLNTRQLSHKPHCDHIWQHRVFPVFGILRHYLLFVYSHNIAVHKKSSASTNQETVWNGVYNIYIYNNNNLFSQNVPYHCEVSEKNRNTLYSCILDSKSVLLIYLFIN